MSESILSSSIVFIVFLILCIVIYFFLNYKGLKSRKKYFKYLHTNLKKGQKVEFAGGILGRVSKVDQDIVEVEISKGIIIKVNRYAISKIVND